MTESNESGMAPLRRDAVVASDLIAMRELLKAEAQAIHQLAQTAIMALDEKSAAQFLTLTQRMEALNHALEEKLEALNEAGWDRIKDADIGARERVTALQEQLTVIERLAVERLDSVRREIILMQKNADEAISKAAMATERRFESVNEFRAQQGDIIKMFATKTEFKAQEDKLAKVEERAKDLEQWRSNTEGRQAIRAILWPVLVGLVVFILTQLARIAFPLSPP